MKSVQKLLALGVVMAASSSFAFADSVTGGVAIGGLDTFTNQSISFDSGTLLGASGTLSAVIPATIQLTNFSFANAAGTTLFTATGLGGIVASFTIDDLTEDSYSTSPTLHVPELALAGKGVFNETGYDATEGTFSLTSSQDSLMSFQLNGGPASVTPEPNSLVLLGTGLIGAAGLMFMRRRNAANLL